MRAGTHTAPCERLEPRTMLAGDDWRSWPIAIEPAGSGSQSDTAAFDLIGAPQQRQQFGLTGAGYSVAVLDTGLDYHNPAFAGRYLGGWDFVNGDADPMDDNGHGTHVAGIIASADDAYPGVATRAGIIALKVLDGSGSGSFGNVDAALAWVAAHQAQYHIAAVNMSLGSGNYASNPFTMLDADLQELQREGVFVAAAAGNGFYAYGSQPGLAFPASDPLVVSVGATWAGDYGAAAWANGAKDYSTAADQIASFTQRSSALDILAPGAYVTSTYLNDSFASMAGTSMASPMVAGAAIIIRQALDAAGKPGDQSAILDVMRATGIEIVDAAHGQDNVQHTGLTFQRLDLLAAVASITPHRTPSERYVADLYRTVLGREPDASGLDFWAKALNAGTPRQQVAAAVLGSPEHEASLVRDDYLRLLGRQPSAGEIAFWLGRMQSGMGELDVERAFLHSAEFLSPGRSDAQLVTAAYRAILGRDAESGAVDFWSGMLSAGGSRASVVDAVFTSEEHIADIAAGLYQGLLHREASQPELAWWAGVLAGGATLESVAEQFLASDEFYRGA